MVRSTDAPYSVWRRNRTWCPLQIFYLIGFYWSHSSSHLIYCSSYRSFRISATGHLLHQVDLLGSHPGILVGIFLTGLRLLIVDDICLFASLYKFMCFSTGVRDINASRSMQLFYLCEFYIVHLQVFCVTSTRQAYFTVVQHNKKK